MSLVKNLFKHISLGILLCLKVCVSKYVLHKAYFFNFLTLLNCIKQSEEQKKHIKMLYYVKIVKTTFRENPQKHDFNLQNIRAYLYDLRLTLRGVMATLRSPFS